MDRDQLSPVHMDTRVANQPATGLRPREVYILDIDLSLDDQRIDVGRMQDLPFVIHLFDEASPLQVDIDPPMFAVRFTREHPAIHLRPKVYFGEPGRQTIRILGVSDDHSEVLVDMDLTFSVLPL